MGAGSLVFLSGTAQTALASSLRISWYNHDVIQITSTCGKPCKNPFWKMKRLLQRLGVMVVVLLWIAPPGFSATLCDRQSGKSSGVCSDCPMSVSAMGMDCLQLSQMAATHCAFDCCRNLPALVAVQRLRADTIGRLVSPLLAVVPATQKADRAAITSWPPGISSQPERHILLQIFRI